jgi:hypothetical protein
MKILLMLLLFTAPASAGWGRAEGAAVSGLAASRAEISVIGGAPLLDLLAARDKASLPLELGGRKLLASVVFDADWNAWFMLKPASGLGAGAWTEGDLAAGVIYKYGGLELVIRKAGDAISIGSAAGGTEISMNGLFDLLYEKSMKATFGGVVTYAVFRNLEPMTGDEGTIALRVGSDGLYYYSLTPDRNIESYPRWLLAVNGVLYGLRVDSGSLLFVSKNIEMEKGPVSAERSRAR